VGHAGGLSSVSSSNYLAHFVTCSRDGVIKVSREEEVKRGGPSH
jgi:hypothetical protein